MSTFDFSFSLFLAKDLLHQGFIGLGVGKVQFKMLQEIEKYAKPDMQIFKWTSLS